MILFLYSEFDVAAYVVHVGEVYQSSQQKKQWIFVSDGSMYGLQSEKLTNTLLAICFCSPLIDHDSFPPINYNLAGSTVITMYFIFSYCYFRLSIMGDDSFQLLNYELFISSFILYKGIYSLFAT